LHKTQHDLLKAKEKAEESDKLKSAFLANMSHEIRTPLNSIIGFSELLTDSDFGQVERTEFAQIINKSGNNLLAILSDIMDLSKIEAGQVQVMKSTLFVSKLLAEIQQEFLYNAAAKGIELKLDSLNPPTVIINGDETKIRQIIANLINNALKFTHAGYVELGVRVLDNQVCFHIKDTGIGIPAEFQQQIFERFRQIESSHNRKYGGNGLGLAISKSLVELLGGKIWVESEINRGTTFYFTVPN
jgi:signal transduction histidine kinase